MIIKFASLSRNKKMTYVVKLPELKVDRSLARKE